MKSKPQSTVFSCPSSPPTWHGMDPGLSLVGCEPLDKWLGFLFGKMGIIIVNNSQVTVRVKWINVCKDLGIVIDT